LVTYSPPWLLLRYSTYTHAHTHTHPHAHTHTLTHTCARAHTHTHTCAQRHIYTQCTHTQMIQRARFSPHHVLHITLHIMFYTSHSTSCFTHPCFTHSPHHVLHIHIMFYTDFLKTTSCFTLVYMTGDAERASSERARAHDRERE